MQFYKNFKEEDDNPEILKIFNLPLDLKDVFFENGFSFYSDIIRLKGDDKELKIKQIKNLAVQLKRKLIFEKNLNKIDEETVKNIKKIILFLENNLEDISSIYWF